MVPDEFDFQVNRLAGPWGAAETGGNYKSAPVYSRWPPSKRADTRPLGVDFNTRWQIHGKTKSFELMLGVGITSVGGKFVKIEGRKGVVDFWVRFLKEDLPWMLSI